MSEPTTPPDEPKPDNPQLDEPKPTPLDLTDEEWIAASQSCCGAKE